MKRILYVTDSLILGGTEQQLVELIRGLDRHRFEPSVLCLYGENVGRSLHFLESLQEMDVPVAVLDRLSKLSLVAGIVRSVWRTRPDLVQAVNYHSNLLVRIARPFLPLSTKVIGCIYIEYTRKQVLYEWLSAWMCNALVCNSPHIEQQLRAALGRCRIELIFNGIDSVRFAHNLSTGLRDCYAPNAHCVFLVIGRIARQKAVPLVVEALGLLKQRGQLPNGVFLWIVGERTEPPAQEQLEQAIEEWGLESVVRQFSATKRPETYYQAADVVVLASLREGLPNVILESMAAGRPVVVSEAANGAGVVNDGKNGWVVQTGDVEDMAAVLAQVLDSLGGLYAMRPRVL